MQNELRYKHIFLDMDGTLTESRQIISEEMDNAISKLRINNDIVVISGAEKDRIVYQLSGLGVDYIMAQSGNDTAYWRHTLTEHEKERILKHALTLIDYANDGEMSQDMIDDRGCQISLSFTGHNADLELKKAYDPDGTKRTRYLKAHPFIHDKLTCRVAGTTCLDFTRKDGTKGKNIQRLIEYLGWDRKDCIYFGDKLKKGGNDESVIGVIKVVEVKNPTDLLIKLKEYV